MKVEHGFALISAAAGAGAGVTSSMFSRWAEELNENTIVKGVNETAEQTAKRFADADYYEHWSRDLSLTAFALFAVAVALTIAGSARNRTQYNP